MQNLSNNLIQTATIISELSDLFQNTPRQCLKQSASGWSNNQRIVFVRDKRVIYAKHYEGFKQGEQIQIPQKYIKSFVNLQDIYEVNYLPIDKIQKKTLSILIPQKRINQQPIQSNSNPTPNIASPNSANSSQPIIAQTRVDNTSTNKQQRVKFIKWIFHFSYDLKQKLHQIRAVKKQQQRMKNQLCLQQQGQQQKQQYELKFAHKIDYDSDARNTPKSVNNNQRSYEQQISLHEYVNQIKKAKDYIKFKQNRQKMQKNQRRKNKPNQQKYQQYKPFSSQQQNFPIMSHWRMYFSCLQDLVRNKNTDKTIYQYELAVYKQVHSFKQACVGIFKNYIFEKLNAVNGEKWEFEGFYFYKGVWIKLGGKELNQQFLMYYNIADLTNLLNPTLKIPYRVPDICLVDYLGFKALIMCDLPFSQIQRSQVYNLYNDKHDLQNISKIKDQLVMIQRALNLKNEDIQRSNKRVSAPLSKGLRMFEYHPKRDIKNDQSLIEQCYYLTNVENIFPLDFNFQLQKTNLSCRFRPQLIGDIRQILQLQYDDTQLLSTAFMISSMNQQLKTRQDDKVVKTSKYLLNQRIPQFVDILNNCQLIIVDSYSLKMYMSQFGINMRYMYRVYELAKIRYLKQVIEIQCLARTIKVMFLDALRQLTASIHNQRKRDKENLFNDFQAQKGQYHHQVLQQKFKQDQVRILDNTMDFLNLVFGNGEETKAFWGILCDRTCGKFNVRVGYPFEGSAGALLHAVLYNCGIEAVFDIDIPLFRAQSPFNKSNQITLLPKTKTFDFPSFQIQKLIRSVPNLSLNNHPDKQLLQSIALKLFKMDLLKNYYLFYGENNYHLSLSKINLLKDDMQKPRHINSHHPSEISYYISNKTQVNFEKGLNLMTFCYSDYHPLYVSFYQEYSKYSQPQLLKKTAIMHSVKCFGEFHPRTTQMYSDAYSSGYKQFYKKSLRTSQILSAKVIIKGQFQSGKYQSCMDYCLKQMQMSTRQQSRIKKQNCLQYLQILFLGMKCAIEIRHLSQALNISNSISDLLNKFKLRNYIYHYQLVRLTLRVKLILAPEKLFLYKLVLLCISTREKFGEEIKKSEVGRVVEAEGKVKEVLAMGIMNQYFTHDTHALWLNNILKHLLASYQYFNHLEDLFNNFYSLLIVLVIGIFLFVFMGKRSLEIIFIKLVTYEDCFKNTLISQLSCNSQHKQKQLPMMNGNAKISKSHFFLYVILSFKFCNQIISSKLLFKNIQQVEYFWILILNKIRHIIQQISQGKQIKTLIWTIMSLRLSSKIQMSMITDAIFGKYDANKTGYLEQHQVKQFLVDIFSGSSTKGRQMIGDFFKCVDTNGDKKISKREIEVLIKKTFMFEVNKNKP